jgi:hypothetical protein
VCVRLAVYTRACAGSYIQKSSAATDGSNQPAVERDTVDAGPLNLALWQVANRLQYAFEADNRIKKRLDRLDPRMLFEEFIIIDAGDTPIELSSLVASVLGPGRSDDERSTEIGPPPQRNKIIIHGL